MKLPEVQHLLDPDTEGKLRNGLLHPHYIYNLNLNADLVLLSGCQTPLGRNVRGEGSAGPLTRGFLYAGSPQSDGEPCVMLQEDCGRKHCGHEILALSETPGD